MSSNHSAAAVCQHFFDRGDINCYSIAKSTGLEYSTVKYYYRKFKKFDSTETRTRSGRPRKVTPEMAIDIDLLVSRDKFISTTEMKKQLSEIHTVKISEATIQRELHNSGFKCVLPRRVPALKPHHIKKRIEWSKSHSKHDWNNTIFSDESSIQLIQNTRKVWTRNPKDETLGCSKFPQKVFFWGAIYLGGRSSIEIIEGIMTASVYRDILQRRMLPLIPKKGYKKPFFQQDNDSKHTSRLLKEFFIEKKVKVIDWPACSPDLNPIENVWAFLKKAVEKREPQSTSELKQMVVEEWGLIPQLHIDNCIKSMPRRISDVIVAKGKKIKY